MNCYVTTNRLVFILLVIEFLLSSVLCADNSWTKHQFKILIEPQKLECFHQHVKEKALFHVSFQVMKGDVISTYVFDPNRNLLNSVIDQQTGSYQIPHSPVDGNYEVCFDNQNSNFAWKLVSIYILTFEQEILLEKFKEDKEFNETTTIVKESTNKIGFNIAEIFTHQALSRFRQTRDDYLIEANNSLVMYWSLAQSIVIVFCGLFQVYFIKRLFSATSYPKSSRSFN